MVCRRGNPLKPADLDLVSLDTARSVIVLAPPVEDADIDVIKMLLLLSTREWRPNRPHVVAAVPDSGNLAAALLAGGAAAQVVDADDISVRLVVQSHRQAGSARSAPTCSTSPATRSTCAPSRAGRPDVRRGARTRTSWAAHRPAPADGAVRLNPPMDTVIAEGDEIIVIAEDDLLITWPTEPAPITTDAITALEPAAGAGRRTP